MSVAAPQRRAGANMQSRVGAECDDSLCTSGQNFSSLVTSDAAIATKTTARVQRHQMILPLLDGRIFI